MFRFFGRFLPARDVGSAPFWGRLAYRYVEALIASGSQFRLVSTTPVDFGRHSLWHAWSERFVADVGGCFMNVVCENAQAAEHLWSDGMVNVAIAAVEFEGQDLPWASYSKYDYVIAPSESQLKALLAVGVGAVVVRDGIGDYLRDIERLRLKEAP